MRFLNYLICLLLPSYCVSQEIRGKILDTETHKAIKSAAVFRVTPCYTCKSSDSLPQTRDHIFFVDGIWYNILDSTSSNEDGNYSFTKIPYGKYFIIASYSMPLNEYNLRGSRDNISNELTVNSSLTLKTDIYLPVVCEYDKYKVQPFCPLCKKKDKLLPIKYGLLVPRYDSLGNSIDKPEKYYPGGCVMDMYCNPTRHCTRCNKSF